MTAIEISAHTAVQTRAAKARAPFFAPLWEAWRRHREQQKTLHLLQGLDAHALRDMGFEPAEIYGLRIGTIGEVHGDAWKGLDK